MVFQHDVELHLGGQSQGRSRTIFGQSPRQVECLAEALHFAKVRGEDCPFRKEREHLIVGRKKVERIGIKQQRHCRLRLCHESVELSAQGPLRFALSTNPGSDDHALPQSRLLGCAPVRGAVGVKAKDGLGQRGLENGVGALGDVCRQFPHPTAQSRSRGQEGRPHHAVAAGHQQHVSKRPLVPLSRAWAQERCRPFGCYRKRGIAFHTAKIRFSRQNRKLLHRFLGLPSSPHAFPRCACVIESRFKRRTDFFLHCYFSRLYSAKKNLHLVATRRQGVAFHRQSVERCTGQRQQELVEG